MEHQLFPMYYIYVYERSMRDSYHHCYEIEKHNWHGNVHHNAPLKPTYDYVVYYSGPEEPLRPVRL